MKTKITQIFSLLGFLLLMMLVNNVHATVIIDDFNSYQEVNETAPGPNTLNDTNVIGAYRTMYIWDITSGGEASLVSGYLGGDTLALNNDSGVKSNAIVIWDANGSGLGGIDITESGVNTHFRLAIVTLDQGAIKFIFTVKDTSSNVGTFTETNAGTGLYTLPFTSFTGTVDFTALNFISLEMDTIKTAQDLEIDLIETGGGSEVPEPGTLILIGAGLVGIAGYAKFGRKKKA